MRGAFLLLVDAAPSWRLAPSSEEPSSTLQQTSTPARSVGCRPPPRSDCTTRAPLGDACARGAWRCRARGCCGPCTPGGSTGCGSPPCTSSSCTASSAGVLLLLRGWHGPLVCILSPFSPQRDTRCTYRIRAKTSRTSALRIWNAWQLPGAASMAMRASVPTQVGGRPHAHRTAPSRLHARPHSLQGMAGGGQAHCPGRKPRRLEGQHAGDRPCQAAAHAHRSGRVGELHQRVPPAQGKWTRELPSLELTGI